MWNRIIFLSVLAAIGVVSASLCAPALPFIADHFSAHFSHIQFTISLFLIGNAFGQFLSGPLSDRVGQRLALMGGLLLYILASCLCACCEQMGVLLMGRFFQGMGSAVGPVLSRAIAVRSFSASRSAQVQSYSAIGVGIASMLAILLSGRLTVVSWRGNFWLAGALGVVLFFWTARALPAVSLTLQPMPLRKIFLEMRRIFKHPLFFKSAVSHSLTYGLMYGYIALFPFLLIEIFHEKNPTQVGIYSAYMIGCYMIGSWLAARFVPRLSSSRLVVMGIVVQIASGALLSSSFSTLQLFAGLVLFNFSIGVILPLTAASALAPFATQGTGTASSSLGLSYRLVGSLLSALICQFPIAGGRNLGLAILLLSCASLVAFRRDLPAAA